MSTEKVITMQQTPAELPINKGVNISLPSTGTTITSNPTYPVHQHLNKININPVEQLKTHQVLAQQIQKLKTPPPLHQH